MSIKELKPAELCKYFGVNGVDELEVITGQQKRTLFNWAKNKPDLFYITVLGASKYLERKSMGQEE